MDIILKDMGLLFPEFTEEYVVSPNNIDVSCDGTLITYVASQTKKVIDTKITPDNINLEIVSSTGEFGSDNFTIQNTFVSLRDSVTSETISTKSADVDFVLTQNDVRKITRRTLTLQNPVAPSVRAANRKIHGFTGQITSSEIIAWNALFRLKASGKTNKIWDNVNLTSNVYTNLVGTRNPYCWIGDLDISGIPIGNNIFETWSQANMGCLIAPQVGIGVAHWTWNFGTTGVGIDRNLTSGRQIAFKANDGVLHVRTVIASVNFFDAPNNGTGAVNTIPFSSLDYASTPPKPISNFAKGDVVIYLLSSPLPETVRPLKFAGSWLYDNETNIDNSQTIARSKRPLITAKEFFSGIGYGIDQNKRAYPIAFSAFRNRNSIYFDWNGHRSDVPDTPNMGLTNLSIQHDPLWTANFARAYYDENPNTQPLSIAEENFYGADTFYRYFARGYDVGDSGTPFFFEGDGGQLCFIGLNDGGAEWLNYRGLPFINAQIEAMKTWAGYAGTVAYPQIMAKPTNTSKVERP